MRRDGIIVTKRRYGLWKLLVVIIFLSVEYRMLLDKQELFWGYLCLMGILLVNGHNKKVYLPYETELSLVIKTIVLDIALLCFCAPDSWRSVLFLTAINIISVIMICIIMNGIVHMQRRSIRRILYICGDWEKDMADIPEEQILSVNEKQELIEQAILDHDEIYLVDLTAERRNDLMKFCYAYEKTVYCTAKLSDVLLKASGLSQDGDVPIFYCTRFGIGGSVRWLKRIFDIVCSLLALVILSPVFALTAICIKLEDGGPAIYRQIRCTEGLREFQIYKFRSMQCDSERDGAQLFTENDERLTKVGRIIRELKIDELPQLLNILKGDMSIVGPRPERPELIEKAIQEVPEFILRTKVKAGLTGYAQVRGRYDTNYLEKLKWDLMYIENYSFLLDLKIIIMTFFVIISKAFSCLRRKKGL